MGPHDNLIAKWRDRRVAGDHPLDRVIDPVNLRPDSFCATSSVLVDSPAGSGSAVVFLDSPADFVAWLRCVNLPHSLSQGAWKDSRAPRSSLEDPLAERNAFRAHELEWPDYTESAEAYIGRFGDNTDGMIRECLAIMDGTLDKVDITGDDAGRVIAAYNRLFTQGDFGVFESTFEAYDSLVDCLRHYGEWFEILEDEELEDPDIRAWTLEMHKLGTLLESGALDLDIPEHLQLVRNAMETLEESLLC